MKAASLFVARLLARRIILVTAAFLAAAPAAAEEKDRHAGYYYPPATVSELAMYQAVPGSVSKAEPCEPALNPMVA